MLVQAKALPKQTFQGITFYRLLNLFPGYRESQSGEHASIFPNQDSDAGIPVAYIFFKNLLEIDGAG